VRTYSPKLEEIQKHWHIIDASEQTLGRLATVAANLLRGKNKPEFTPHLDCGDYVIVINAEVVKVTGRKEDQKLYRRHSGFPHGFKEETLGTLRERRPVAIIERAIRGMIPHTRLGDHQFTNLKVYAGSEHPHEAQQPKPYDLVGKKEAKV
jgi:large subunit ribosomal protein L13